MDSFRFIITGELPSLNEYTGANRVSRYKGGNIKKIATNKCFIAATNALRSHKVKPNPDKLYDLSLIWKVKNNKKDSDNVFFAVKFVLDGMSKAGIIADDSRKYIRNISHRINTDKREQGVSILLTEVKGVK